MHKVGEPLEGADVDMIGSVENRSDVNKDRSRKTSEEFVSK